MPPIYRKITLRERIYGRDPDTAEVVVYKNLTLGEWFYGGRNVSPKQRKFNAVANTIVILLGIVSFVMISVILILKLGKLLPVSFFS